MIPTAEDRREERNPLDVVPVRVREEEIPTNRRPVRPAQQVPPQLADARACVEDCAMV